MLDGCLKEGADGLTFNHIHTKLQLEQFQGPCSSHVTCLGLHATFYHAQKPQLKLTTNSGFRQCMTDGCLKEVADGLSFKHIHTYW